jgi:hypothetical protein
LNGMGMSGRLRDRDATMYNASGRFKSRVGAQGGIR